MSEAPTYALRTTLQVDEEQIVTALRQEVQKRLYGPEFSTSDLVVFTDAILPQGGSDDSDDPFGDDYLPDDLKAALQPGRVAIIASYDAAKPKPYFLFLTDGNGEIARLSVRADQIAAYGQ